MLAEVQGISIVIVTYKRNKTLKRLLKSILRQRVNLPVEVILINNWGGQVLKKSKYFGLSGLLNKFTDIKIINSSDNLGCSVRYNYATSSKYNTIMILDDDVELRSKNFVIRMYNFYLEKDEYDIVSSWCQIFKPNDINYFSAELVNFECSNEEIEVDLAGPGISMFNKKLLVNDFVNIPEKYRDVDNVWFSIMSTLLKGSKKYYFPSKKMIRFVDNHDNAMYTRGGMEDMKIRSTKELINKGYVIVKQRSEN